jgi:hypothetical protein
VRGAFGVVRVSAAFMWLCGRRYPPVRSCEEVPPSPPLAEEKGGRGESLGNWRAAARWLGAAGGTWMSPLPQAGERVAEGRERVSFSPTRSVAKLTVSCRTSLFDPRFWVPSPPAPLPRLREKGGRGEKWNSPPREGNSTAPDYGEYCQFSMSCLPR